MPRRAALPACRKIADTNLRATTYKEKPGPACFLEKSAIRRSADRKNHGPCTDSGQSAAICAYPRDFPVPGKWVQAPPLRPGAGPYFRNNRIPSPLLHALEFGIKPKPGTTRQPNLLRCWRPACIFGVCVYRDARGNLENKMKYRRLANTDVSEVALDTAACRVLSSDDFTELISTALDSGINFFHTLKPEETSAAGQALKTLSARRNAIVSAGIEDFFAAFSRHRMRLEDFLEHELEDRLVRLESTYLDCLVINLGRGRSVDLEGARREGISGAGDDKAVELEQFEGGTFLHETIGDFLDIADRFRHEGRVRIIGLSGENVDALRRVLVKHSDFDAVIAPYSYGFRAAAEELLPVAEETKTAFVAARPLWWNIRDIPVTVLAESPFPKDKAVRLKASRLALAACKWPLQEKAVVSVCASARTSREVESLAGASGDQLWTRADEEALRQVAGIAAAAGGLFVALSAMNSADAETRARGWAVLVRKNLTGGEVFNPDAPRKERQEVLERIAAAVVPKEPVIPDEDIDELL